LLIILNFERRDFVNHSRSDHVNVKLHCKGRQKWQKIVTRKVRRKSEKKREKKWGYIKLGKILLGDEDYFIKKFIICVTFEISLLFSTAAAHFRDKVIL